MANAPIVLTGANTTEVVAARSGARIRVLSYVLPLASGETVQWKSGTTALSGTMLLGASSGRPVEQHMITAYGEALNITHTASAGGHLEYEYVS